MIAMVRPTRAFDPELDVVAEDDLTVHLPTAELLDLEAALAHRLLHGRGLDEAGRIRLRAIEREINRRWSIES